MNPSWCDLQSDYVGTLKWQRLYCIFFAILLFIYIFWFIFLNFFFQIMRFPSSHGLMIQPTPRCSTCCQCWMLSDLCLMSDQFYHEIEKHIGYGNYLCFKLLILSNWAMFYIKQWFHEFMNARIILFTHVWQFFQGLPFP